METLRVALIGKTGAGKSALGNTLIGRKVFETNAGAESVTFRCDIAAGLLPSGRQITVVDTPGIMDTTGKDVSGEVAKAIAALSPGPHAFIIVLQPGRATEEEKEVIKQLTGMFGDEGFLAHTIIVMTRRDDITDEHDRLMDIHHFIKKLASRDVQQLYERCGRRIVAVENKHSSPREKGRYAREVTDEIINQVGYYSHVYFKILAKNKLQTEEIAILRRELGRVASQRRRSVCTII